MAMKFEVFDAPTLVLSQGIHVVEASAGTGKTYAISMLVLRALVELDIALDQILVVTFTKAATEELKSRIRSRMVEARNLLLASHMEQEQVDDTLLAWAETIADRAQAAARIGEALMNIDRAQIFTIHGFCQRMLSDHALESGQLFDLELLADISQVRNQVVEDFWRKHLYSMEPLACGLITSRLSSPAELLDSVSSAGNSGCAIVPSCRPVADVARSLGSSLAAMVDWWEKNAISLKGCFVLGIEMDHFKKRIYHEFDQWFSGIERFFSGDTTRLPPNLDILTPDKIAAELKATKFRTEAQKEDYLSRWPLPGKVLDSFVEECGELLLAFRVELAADLRREVSSRLIDRGYLGFDDLIFNLAEHLKNEPCGLLQKMLADRFSFALIDEFQDTDSDQYFIFRTLFGNRKHLYLIGDPKQAIYKFRGADINSYFRAKQEATRLLTLHRNYRSHPRLVAAVNHLFVLRTKPFYYEKELLDYQEIDAAQKEDELFLQQGNRSFATMVYRSLPPNDSDKLGRWSAKSARTIIRGYVVAETVALLASRPPLVLGKKDEKTRELGPKDIAILVRTHKEAEEFRNELAMAGVPVVVASRQSVYHSNECREMVLVLQAISHPADITVLKSGLAVSWFGLTGNDLFNLEEDDDALSRWQGRMTEYYSLWQQQGFLTMMGRLLTDEKVFVRLAGKRFAERAIANVHQLLELIQEQETAEKLGARQLVRWLKKMMADQAPDDSAELLLESDEDAVQVVTMHSAKGLEYPVVFCPSLWGGSNFIAGEKYQVSGYDDHGRTVVDLGSDLFEARKNEAVVEQHAEDLRLLYVALTRAKLRCYVMWADVKKHGGRGIDSFDSALGYVLFPDGPCPAKLQREQLDGLAGRQNAVHEVVDPAIEPQRFSQRKMQEKLEPLGLSPRPLFTDWQLSSFSAMAAMSDYEYERLHPVLKDSKSKGGAGIVVADLPAGAGFGNVVHNLLEKFSFSTIYCGEQLDNMAEQCRRQCRSYGVECEVDSVLDLLKTVVSTPLFGNTALGQLEDSTCVKEMEFCFHLGAMVTEQVNKVLAGERTVLPVSRKTMKGYLAGFVDLVCRHRGKYYIIDYKTNYLGDLAGDYDSASLAAAMQSHNYGLQYWIYTLVLHTHLNNIVPQYDYLTHFGGVKYLFVRGMNPAVSGSGVYSTLPDRQTLEALGRVMGGGSDD
ncbi:exodeoxyribonuclease V subunit beta [Desulforhopalus singaporensis]|uniref:DNA 3'-5' helicase n=1 Tax=Desulforhopalus singaporensis TaxID=91360 RepID=A0A1H0TLI6_9BACT|nr:exodeoxyribonuclease V subunit beta [Desulforhopalus singaporensis]SDP54894.1 DNA helicase/exodeoxyribonuclease V, beta subunit [Desulforhopalus singaporensis]